MKWAKQQFNSPKTPKNRFLCQKNGLISRNKYSKISLIY